MQVLNFSDLRNKLSNKPLSTKNGMTENVSDIKQKK